jgi:hypothetical protein
MVCTSKIQAEKIAAAGAKKLDATQGVPGYTIKNSGISRLYNVQFRVSKPDQKVPYIVSIEEGKTSAPAPSSRLTRSTVAASISPATGKKPPRTPALMRWPRTTTGVRNTASMQTSGTKTKRRERESPFSDPYRYYR